MSRENQHLKEEAARAQCKEIMNFVAGTIAAEAPILPTSAVLNYNIDLLAQYLCTQVPVPRREFLCAPEMYLVRSFDVNKPGTEPAKLKGGVAGGCLIKGCFRLLGRRHLSLKTLRGFFSRDP